MPLGKVSDVKDQVVEDNQLLAAFLHFHLELFIAHHIQGLIELDRVLTQESLMEELESAEQDDKERNGNVVEHCVDVPVVRVRVDPKKDCDLTHHKHQVCKRL